MALTIASASAQAMGAALATDIGAGAIIEIRSGAKPATIMHQIAKGYTDAQLDLIAAYFAARK